MDSKKFVLGLAAITGLSGVALTALLRKYLGIVIVASVGFSLLGPVGQWIDANSKHNQTMALKKLEMEKEEAQYRRQQEAAQQVVDREAARLQKIEDAKQQARRAAEQRAQARRAEAEAKAEADAKDPFAQFDDQPWVAHTPAKPDNDYNTVIRQIKEQIPSGIVGWMTVDNEYRASQLCKKIELPTDCWKSPRNLNFK
jgi:hypothetical protein